MEVLTLASSDAQFWCTQWPGEALRGGGGAAPSMRSQQSRQRRWTHSLGGALRGFQALGFHPRATVKKESEEILFSCERADRALAITSCLSEGHF